MTHLEVSRLRINLSCLYHEEVAPPRFELGSPGVFSVIQSLESIVLLVSLTARFRLDSRPSTGLSRGTVRDELLYLFTFSNIQI